MVCILLYFTVCISYFLLFNSIYILTMRGGKRPNSGRKQKEESALINFRVTVSLYKELKKVANLSDKFKEWAQTL